MSAICCILNDREAADDAASQRACPKGIEAACKSTGSAAASSAGASPQCDERHLSALRHVAFLSPLVNISAGT